MNPRPMARTDSKVILVLGAYGEAGTAITRGLAATRAFEVVGSGRNREKLEILQSSCEDISVLQLDVADRRALDAALGRAGLVINCVGPYIGLGLDVARAAVEAHVPYFDLASEQEHYRRLQSLQDACRHSRGLIVTGLGAYPGLSGILLEGLMRKYPGAESAEMALVAGHHADPAVGTAQHLSGIIELAYELTELTDEKLVRVRPGSRRRFEFPQPFGACNVMRWPQMEILSIASTGRLRAFSTFVALGGHEIPPPFVFDLLGFLRPTPNSLVLAACKRFAAGLTSSPTTRREVMATNHGAIVIVIRVAGTTKRASAVVSDLPAATAWFPVHTAKLWAAGELEHRGVAIPMEIFEPEPVLAELRKAAGRELFALNGL